MEIDSNNESATPISDSLYPARSPTVGTGTKALRRTKPTLDSTEPFSWPAWGLQKVASNPKWSLNRRKSLLSRTSPATLLPTPVALSNTIRCGTPPMCRKMAMRPSHTHSAVVPPNTWNQPMLDWGNASTRKNSLLLSPLHQKSASPKSHCAVPGAQTRSRNADDAWRIALLRSLT